MVGWAIYYEKQVWPLLNWQVGKRCQDLISRWDSIYFISSKMVGYSTSASVPLVGAHLRQGGGGLAWGPCPFRGILVMGVGILVSLLYPASGGLGRLLEVGLGLLLLVPR